MKTYIFNVEVPYWRISIGKALQLWQKGFRSECHGNKKVAKLKFIFKEVKFNVQSTY